MRTAQDGNTLEPIEQHTKGNRAEFGILYDERGEATDEIFITLKKENNEEITVAFSIEQAAEFYATMDECIKQATLTRHGKFTRPLWERKMRES